MSADPLPFPYILIKLRTASKLDWGWPVSLSPVEARLLAAEIEALQAHKAQSEQITQDHTEQLIAEGERRATEHIVAWLRDTEESWHMRTWQVADAIERGEHCRKENT